VCQRDDSIISCQGLLRVLTKQLNNHTSVNPDPHSGAMPAPAFAALRDFVKTVTHGEIQGASEPSTPQRPVAAPIATRAAAAPVANPASNLLDQPTTDEPADARQPSGKLPSGWYQKPAVLNTDVWPSEIRAAGMGLAAGLLLLVPIALWLNPAATKRFKPEADLAALANRLVADARTDASLGTDLLDLITGKPLALADAQEPAELEEARQMIADGDVVGARTALATAAAARSPQALFLMAETFDPNMLAAWGTRGVAADFERARSLYAAANALGHEEADSRLAALK
jgi:hypothetical protein